MVLRVVLINNFGYLFTEMDKKAKNVRNLWAVAIALLKICPFSGDKPNVISSGTNFARSWNPRIASS